MARTAELKESTSDRPARPATLDRIAWPKAAAELDGYGCATVGPLLSPQQCRSLSTLYASESPFRRRIVMVQHGFGRGEYKYFAYPLPPLIEALRTALYPPLAAIANRWNEEMGVEVRYPA